MSEPPLTEDPVTAWFHEFQPGAYGLYTCGRSFIRSFSGPAMRRAAWWACLRCRWLCPRAAKRAHPCPPAGRYLEWQVRCDACGCHYVHLTDNSPQVTGPWTRDRSRPRHHFPGMPRPWRRCLATWVRMVRHNTTGV